MNVADMIAQRAANANLDWKQLNALAQVQHPERGFDSHREAVRVRDVFQRGSIADLDRLLDGRTALERAALFACYNATYHGSGAERGDLNSDAQTFAAAHPREHFVRSRVGVAMDTSLPQRTSRLLAGDQVGADAAALAEMSTDVPEQLRRYDTPARRQELDARMRAEYHASVDDAVKRLPARLRDEAQAVLHDDAPLANAWRIERAVRSGDAEAVVGAIAEAGNTEAQAAAVRAYDSTLAARPGGQCLADAVPDQDGQRLVRAAIGQDAAGVAAARLMAEVNARLVSSDAKLLDTVREYMAHQQSNPEAWNELVHAYERVRGDGSFRRDMLDRTSGGSNSEMRDLLDSNGQLSPAQRLQHAINGIGRNMAEVRAVLEGRSRDEIDRIQIDGRNLREVFAGEWLTDEERAEIDALLDGSDTPERLMRVVAAREQGVEHGSIAGMLNPVTRQATANAYSEAAAAFASYQQARQAFGDNDPRTQAQLATFQQVANEHFELAEQHGRARDQVTDNAKLVAGLVAMAIPTGQGVGGALISAALAGAASSGVGAAMNAGRTSNADHLIDGALTAAELGAGVLVARAAKVASAAARAEAAALMARGVSAEVAAGRGQATLARQLICGAGTNAAQSAVDSGVRSAVHRETWDHGDALETIAQAAAQGALQGAAMSALSALHPGHIAANSEAAKDIIRRAAADPEVRARVRTALEHMGDTTFADATTAREVIAAMAAISKTEHVREATFASPFEPDPSGARRFDLSDPNQTRMARVAYALAGGRGPLPERWTTGDRTYVAREHSPEATAARVNTLAEAVGAQTHPDQARLVGGDRSALRDLLATANDWKELVGRLDAGTPQARAVAGLLVNFRTAIVQRLGQLDAALLGKASSKPTSDVDLNFQGTSAGRNLLLAERWMRVFVGRDWSQMLRMSFMTDISRLTSWTKVRESLGAPERAAMQGQLSHEAATYTLARSLAHAQHQGDRAAPAADRILATADRLGVERATVERLAVTTPAQHSTARERLLLHIDGLSARFETSTGRQRTELGIEITRRQMEANFHTPEAYQTAGGGRQVSAKSASDRVHGPDAFEAALDNLEMAEHVLAETHGDTVRAGREYELYKYMHRFSQAARWAGITDPRATYFENLGGYLYGADRAAHSGTGSAGAATLHEANESSVKADQDIGIARHSEGGASYVGRPAGEGPPRSPVSEEFLRTQTHAFIEWAYQTLPELQRIGATDNAAAPSAEGRSARRSPGTGADAPVGAGRPGQTSTPQSRRTLSGLGVADDASASPGSGPSGLGLPGSQPGSLHRATEPGIGAGDLRRDTLVNVAPDHGRFALNPETRFAHPDRQPGETPEARPLGTQWEFVEEVGGPGRGTFSTSYKYRNRQTGELGLLQPHSDGQTLLAQGSGLERGSEHRNACAFGAIARALGIDTPELELVRTADGLIGSFQRWHDGKSALEYGIEHVDQWDHPARFNMDATDYIAGSMDRHAGNFHVLFDEHDPSIVVGVRLFDNKDSFPSSAERFTPDGDVLVAVGQRLSEYQRGIPPWVTKNMMDRLDHMISVETQVRQELRQYLRPAQIDGAMARLRELVRALKATNSKAHAGRPEIKNGVNTSVRDTVRPLPPPGTPRPEPEDLPPRIIP